MAEGFTEFKSGHIDNAAVKRQGFGMVNYNPSDEALAVMFYTKSVQNIAESRAQGIPVFINQDWVKIEIPGERETKIDRQATMVEKQRWPRQWQHYSEGKSQAPDGIPLNILFNYQPNISDTLKAYNIHTIQQLSNLSAHAISTVGMGCTEWVNKAKKYMDQAEKGVDNQKFEAALIEKDSQIAKLQRQLDDLSALVRQRNAPLQQLDPGFDPQIAQLNAVHQSEDMGITPAPAKFVHDLSGETKPRRGRPPGTKNKEH